jgi:pimeloyl-ACP methyl ester carboxylesterase
LNNLPHQSLGYILHDQGFDVWLGNSRGNSYSQDNIHFPRHDKEYWKTIDWGLMAEFDIPAFVGYVRNATGFAKVAYVGHSQGTTQMFAALAANYGNIKEQLTVFVALAPVAYVKHQKSPLLTIMADARTGWWLEMLGDNQFMPNTALLRKLGISCDLIPLGCDMLLFTICGPSNPKNINGSRIDFYLNWEPADTSVQNMMHWAQSVRKEEFSMYDYGKEGNMEHYHQPTAPVFNISNIATPTALFSGGEDWLGDPMDVAQLRADYNPEYLVVDNFQQSYAHLDFVWAINANTLIYPEVIATINKYYNL